MKSLPIFFILLSANINAQSKQWEKMFISKMNHKDGISINVIIDQLQFDAKSFDSGDIEIIDKDNEAKWKYYSILNTPSAWLERHTDLAWDTNPLEDL